MIHKGGRPSRTRLPGAPRLPSSTMGFMAVRRKLSMERAVRRDLAQLAPHLRGGAIATAALFLARRVDAGAGARDTAALLREMRQCVTTLWQIAPVAIPASPVDELRARRESRLTSG